jgi:hypothetical protein
VALQAIACCHDRSVEILLLRGYRQNHESTAESRIDRPSLSFSTTLKTVVDLAVDDWISNSSVREATGLERNEARSLLATGPAK